jgi:HAD superfamily hydrolase (TIGR01509 family)
MLSPGPIELVIFDMDGVLADTEPLHLIALNRQLAREGHALDTRAVAEFLGSTDLDMFRILKPRLQLAREPEAYATEKMQRVIEIVCEGLIANPGVNELVLHLTMNGVRAAVASGSALPLVETVTDVLGLRRSFAGLYSSSMVARGKPAPDLFLHAAATLAVDPAACLVIEDAPAGIAAAKAAGMTAVAVKTTSTAGLDLSAADFVIESLDQFDRGWLDGR